MIRIGIIGTDASAHLHTTVLLTNTAFEIGGCYAQDNRESMLFARKYRLVSYSSLEALFKYSDAIDITADSPEAVALAETSLKAMKHVYIAHPHHLTLDKLQHLVKLSEESGVVLHLGAKHNFCSAYDALAALEKTPRTVAIKHHLTHDGTDLCRQARMELPYDLAFVLGIINANIIKIDVHTEVKPDAYTDVFQCRLECDNGSLVTLIMQTSIMMDTLLEIRFSYPDMEIKTDVFRSVMEKQYNEYDVVDSMVFDPYNERNICKQNLIDFGKAISGDHGVIARIERQVQCFAASDVILEHVRQTRMVSALS